MGFFYASQKTSASKSSKRQVHIPVDTMRSMGCRACPLASGGKDYCGKVRPDGPEDAELYFLTEPPSEKDDKAGLPFSGESGRLVESVLPRSFMDKVRLGNIIHCRLTKNELGVREVECCRKNVIADIEQTKPLVVIGFGHAPLSWYAGFTSSVNAMRGRLVPIKVGSHVCWYYAVFSPEYVMRNTGKYGKSETEKVFENDLNWISKNYRRLKTPEYYESGFSDGVEVIDSFGYDDVLRVEKVLNGMKGWESTAIDLECNGLRPYIDNPTIYTCAIGTFDQVIAFPVKDPRAWKPKHQALIQDILGDFITDSKLKVSHHLPMEMEWLSHFYGNSIAYLSDWGDTMAQAHTLDERIGVLGLGSLTRLHFGFNVKDKSNVDPVRFLEYPIEDGLLYNGMDSKWTHRLYEVQDELLQDEPDLLWEVDHQTRLQSALTFLQQKGLPVDFDAVNELEEQYLGKLTEAEKKVNSDRGVAKYITKYGKFSITAPQDVAKLLHEIYDRDEVSLEGGKLSSDENILSKISVKEVPIISHILEHRQLAKIESTYLRPIKERKFIYPDGLLHPKYGSLVAVTGRLAAEEPNTQNFPKRKHREVRKVIRAPKGHWIVANDYGQIEARVCAMASGDENLCKALWTGYDIHGFWADRILESFPRKKDILIADYGVNGDDVKALRKKMRDETKNGWVFPQFFGSSFRSCAANLQIPERTAELLAAEFWDEFRGVAEWQKWLMKFYDKHLYVATLTGRRRRGAMSKNEMINMPIQGTAADIVKEAMIELSFTAVLLDDPSYQPNLNVHDDLTMIIDDSILDDRIPRIASIMTKPRFDFVNVPLIVEVQVGESWDALEEIVVYSSEQLHNHRKG